MFKQIEICDEQSSSFLGIKSFWRITNNQHVIDIIKILNGHNKATSITCYDFSTFYFNIPHGKLIRILNEHIHFSFKGRDGEFNEVDRYRSPSSNTQKTGSISFTRSSLENVVTSAII